MRNKSTLFTVGALLMLLAFASCQKEGSAGAEGAQGPQGPPGPAGPKGDTGVANVIYSEWLDVAFVPVKDTADNGTVDTLGYQAAIEVPKLTKDIIDKGEIKVYINWGVPDNPVVFPLPHTDFSGLLINPIFAEGVIALISNGDVSTYTDAEGKFFQYRYVLIPGGVLANKPNNVNLQNYSEVKQYLKLKD